MKLSARSRYAARLLLDLAMHEADKPIRTALLSENTGITVQFIEQIIRPLKKAGLIKSVRGAAGGHILDKDPAHITLGEIVRTMEGAINIANCLECETKCERSQACRTRSVWERASRAMEQELDSITLAELLESPEDCPNMD
ncbi:RrF2 family transcriptional regulator [Pseudodesulfovibrio piezophilus]|uniref:Transcriptional regulator, BadM/Rrf2 family n=1 Tax=Pseudodesulfovibrio piezophilus (strain DSM 21447 / JCM 15486 / C1TLV30) TaxID=1322246 RepID=M1WUG7_PSEP2|nr:Rrf2 family transcriptional regulator [Pseudodesulfovibrio piezophilus]CCH47308.1 Transcriptional regulator, BadM/Rrf2 family [Pseudodesulfovibrio piezophilus C1TLV30]